MECFFGPASIAVVGASPERGKWGNNLLRNVLRGFSGPVYPVNPNHREVEGIECYRTVSEIGKPVDLAIVLVPASLMPDTLDACAAAGVKGVILHSAGFGEASDEGVELQDKCRSIGRESGMRLWGPNCAGLLDGVRNHIFSFWPPEAWTGKLIPGGVSLVVQSGILAAPFLIDLMSHGTMGVSKVCSIGNKIDVDECDLLEYLIEDEDTAAIGLYLEAIEKGRRFLEVARRSPKPIVVAKGGRSVQGAKAARSHTASLAGNDRIVSGALSQAGVIQVDELNQLVDISQTLAYVPQGIGKGRVGIVTISGGAGILAADSLVRQGPSVASLSSASVRQLAGCFPSWMPPTNPVDVGPASQGLGPAEAHRRAVEVVSLDPEVDAVLLLACAEIPGFELNIDEMGEIYRHSAKPIFVWLIGTRDGTEAFQTQARRHGIPAFRELGRTVEAMRAAFEYGRRQYSDHRAGPGANVTMSAHLRALQGAILDQSAVLDEFDSKRFLRDAGIPCVSEAIVADPEGAVEFSREVGFPVVLKGLAPGIVHKAEMGLVKLNLWDEKNVREALAEMMVRLGREGRVLLQEQVPVDWEFICGLTRDPQFGPCVLFGRGGVAAEIDGMNAFRVAPLTEKDALDLIESIRGKELLAGFRGRKPVDRSALVHVLRTLGQIGLEFPQVSEIDINPLAASDGRLVALDATVISGVSDKKSAVSG